MDREGWVTSIVCSLLSTAHYGGARVLLSVLLYLVTANERIGVVELGILAQEAIGSSSNDYLS